ncbi:MAG: hypothetical protein ACYDBQ_12625 [Thermoplasmatota archaeon]
MERAFRELRIPGVAPPVPFAQRFNEAADAWERNTAHVSAGETLVEHPQFQKLLALGSAAVPLALRRLDAGNPLWCLLLERLTGEDPVPEASYGNMAAIREAWLDWARTNGISW